MEPETQTGEANEPSGAFDGRSFVSPVAPSGESPSPADGNDAVDLDGEGDGAVPSSATAGDEGIDDGDPDGDGEGGPAAAPAGTFWDQTPEEKRAERFNHAMERSNAQAKELAEYKEKLAKYESGDGPKPAEPKEPEGQVDDEPATPSADDYVIRAIRTEDETKLTEPERDIRRLHLEVLNLHKQTVAPAVETFKAATEAQAEVQKTLSEERTYLAGLKRRAEGREGYFDGEISEAEDSIRQLEMKLTRATAARVDARLDLKEADEAYKLRQSSNRTKALQIATRQGQIHQETEEQKADEQWMRTEQAKLDQQWNDAFTKVATKLGLPKGRHEDALDLAYARVDRINKSRSEENKVTPAEFEKLIEESLGWVAGAARSDAGRSDADAAETRADATAQPGPKKRNAAVGDSKPLTVEEAEANLRNAFRGSRVRVA